MKKISLADRLRYQFDNIMSKGPAALVLALFLSSALLVVAIAAVAKLVGAHPEGGPALSFWELLWMSMLRTLDAGTMGGDTGRWLRFFMFLVTLSGIFIVSLLIGILTTGMEGRIEYLRKGRSVVAEKDHIIILGWSDQIFSIVPELNLAQANKRKSCVAILADRDKVEMEDEIRSKVGRYDHIRVVCRTGSPIDMNDLEIVSPHTSRSIIALSPDNEKDPDSQVIKTIMALTNHPDKDDLLHHIVAEIRDSRHLEIARLASCDEAVLVTADDLIARIIAQTCRQSGLSTVYNDLLNFEGNEIYFSRQPRLAGKTFDEALFAFEDSALIGIRHSDGQIELNPSMNTKISVNDLVVAISRDDDTIRLSNFANYNIDVNAICEQQPRVNPPVNTLLLGWNRCAAEIATQLDNYLPAGSKLLVVADITHEEMELAKAAVAAESLAHLKVSFQIGDTTKRNQLDQLGLADYQHVILVSYSDHLGNQEADARTLITLLHLRDIAERRGHPYSIVSEMLDVRNRALAEVTQADDFIVSDKLVSLMLSQIAENKELFKVFNILFSPGGSDIFMKRASDYVTVGKPVNFYTVLEAARRRGQVAIGYRQRSTAAYSEKNYGVMLNPKKSEMITFSEQDRIILLAEA